MNSRPPLRFRHSAFTLVELLTVIAIIAILMGLLFPALQIVKDQANKVKAKTDIMGTVAAVKQYYTEYGKYPLTAVIQTGSSGQPQDYTFGDNASGGGGSVNDNSMVFNILRNYPGMARGNPDGNPRQIVFFEGRTGIATSGNPRSGFTPTSANSGTGQAGAFYDPWGNEYAMAIDGTYDNWVPVPYLDFPPPSGVTVTSSGAVNVGCAAWSAGKDGKIGNKGDYYFKNNGTPSDDVISWQ